MKFFLKYKTYVAIAVSAVILFFLIRKIDGKNILDALSQCNKPLLIFSGLILVAAPFFSILRWNEILKLLNANAPFKKVVQVYMATYPVAKISPANSGDFVRVLPFRKEVPVTQNIGSIFAERLFDIAGLAIISGVGAIAAKSKFGIVSLLILLPIILFFLIAPRVKIPSAKWQENIKNFFYFFEKLKKNRLIFLKIAGFTLLSWLVVCFQVKLTFLAFGVKIPLLSVMLFHPLAVFVGLLPISLAGIGTREPAMIILFSGLASSSVILAVGLCYSFFGTILFSIICIPFLFLKLKNY